MRGCGAIPASWVKEDEPESWALVLPGGLVLARFFVVPGFVPAAEPLLFRQK
jgi:hypothetical protein